MARSRREDLGHESVGRLCESAIRRLIAFASREDLLSGRWVYFPGGWAPLIVSVPGRATYTLLPDGQAVIRSPGDGPAQKLKVPVREVLPELRALAVRVRAEVEDDVSKVPPAERAAVSGWRVVFDLSSRAQILSEPELELEAGPVDGQA